MRIKSNTSDSSTTEDQLKEVVLQKGTIKPDSTESKRKMAAESRRKLIACALGIFVCYFYYGILQEYITKGKYGEGDKIMVLWHKERDTTPVKMYTLCSLSYLGAMLASNHALQHVSKSAKPIPVMILGIILARKRYPAAKFLFVLMILVSLTLDGLTGVTQERMRSESKTGPYNMMFNVNLWSILWLAIGLVVTGEGVAFLGFVQRHPSVLFHMVTFGIASALGQMFIFVTVTSFGPLTCSIVTTTRKFFTILGSVILFQNPMNNRQWVGTVLVFTGLSLDSAYGKEKKNR
ncbi:hypothetical protein KUTeg_015389 [Tegillarca granosa]|uniref:Solute carrier family 35 member B1 n=1 Tax=Tegillarca granosa TaxID=220873 RepID=A0ABQ9EV82_TEGGR|nr:hypothetical protein KUTeg_015389 [Tegillarca granosa]